jgi:hypothetical protein
MESVLKYYLNSSQNKTREHNSIESLILSVPGCNLNKENTQKEESVYESESLFQDDPEIDKLLKESSRFIKRKKKKAPVYKEQSEPVQESKYKEPEIESPDTSDFEHEYSPLHESLNMQEVVDSQKFYKIYRDKEEVFECKISVEGTTLSNAQVRLFLESDSWNIFFNGKIYNDGRCVVPLKKMSLYSEGTVGKARLEVVVDDVVFVPWEETFKVEGAKKITVEVKPQGKISLNASFKNHNGDGE